MPPFPPRRRLARRLAAACGLFAGVALGAPAAIAGSCPAQSVVASSNRAVETKPSGVTDTVLNTVDLAEAPYQVPGRQLRLRRLVVQPGGVVPVHSHSERPAIIYIVSGQITEYASTCAVPILHRAGESTAEKAPVTHWWRNNSKKPAVLLSADFFPVAGDPHMM